MTYYAVKLANGMWLSRARMDYKPDRSAWDGCFELDHPELWDSESEASKAAKDYKGTVVRAELEEAQ